MVVAISTFVIFDIETTGLPRDERNQTKITELTFLAVDRRDINATTFGQVPILNKLSYLFNPERTIHPEVIALTGLTNSLLQNQQTFKTRIPSLNSFLEGLPKPVCLVAHNGNSFDFKILRTEYIDANAILPTDLLCVDSIWGFKKIIKETNMCYQTLTELNSSKSDEDILTDDEDWPELNTSAEEWNELDKILDSFSHMSPLKDSAKRNTDSISIKNENRSAAIKNLFEKKPQAVSHNCFTLQGLYKRLLNKEVVNAHRSEADCLMLLECVVALKQQFLPYADEKCKKISEVKPFERY